MLKRLRTRQTRSFIALVASLCLLWHLLLPSMMSYGWAPAMFGMSLHCQMLAQAGQTPHTLSTTSANSSVAPAAHAQHSSYQHAHMSHSQHQRDHLQQQHDHKQNMQQINAAPVAHFLALSSTEVNQIMELASKIMKQCPLCSHGFGAAVLLVSFVLLLIGLCLQQPHRVRFSIVRHADAYYQNFRFRLPLAHAPPLFS